MIEKPYAESKKSSNPVPSTCAHPASKIARDFAAAVALGGGGGGGVGGGGGGLQRSADLSWQRFVRCAEQVPAPLDVVILDSQLAGGHSAPGWGCSQPEVQLVQQPLPAGSHVG